MIFVSSMIFRIQSIQNVCPQGKIRGSLNVRLHIEQDVICRIFSYEQIAVVINLFNRFKSIINQKYLVFFSFLRTLAPRFFSARFFICASNQINMR